MRKTVAAVLFNLFFTCLYGQTSYWQQRVNYLIDVRLDDVSHSLDGYVKMDYQNNSPDTLTFIWIHCWPNAYKNDLTAFSDQLLKNGNTDFYFSDAEAKGYINRLSFKVNGTVVIMENHPEHQDIIKIILPAPLAPNTSCKIETPFHVKLPQNMSRGGHNGQSYQITQWYPKPAVYDKKGWHPMPYLNQGEFYSEFGDYKVQISLPQNYVVAATGVQQSVSLEVGEQPKTVAVSKQKATPKKKFLASGKEPIEVKSIVSSSTIKTLVYTQQNVHDFAWFADKQFVIAEDTLALSSGRIIKTAVYYLPGKQADFWKLGLKHLKKAVLSRSYLLGEYPYDIVSVAEGKVDYAGGMEYPTITLISGVENEVQLEQLIEHEVGHNWLYGILASNEREHPWMDEGMNTYYGTRYWNGERDINVREKTDIDFFGKRMPSNLNFFALENQIALHKDQPIETPAENIAANNYNSTAYHKPSRWMKLLETTLGKGMFDSAMHQYYEQWKFKHPYPEDLKRVLETISGLKLDAEFALLYAKGNLPKAIVDRPTKLASFFSFKETEKYKYIFLAPAVGYNFYDKLMIGAVIHNYTLPAEKFQYLAAPIYGIGSKKINGTFKVDYHWYPDTRALWKVEVGINAASFSSNHSLDTTRNKIFERFNKLVPVLKIHFKTRPFSQLHQWLDLRMFLINEKAFDNYGLIYGGDSSRFYPKSFSTNFRYINQVSFNSENTRVLYPYNYQLQLQQGAGFYRINATANYFFNYSKGGGLTARFFVSKFSSFGSKENSTYQFQPKLLAGNGLDDYTYSNYFLSRTASTAYSSPLVGNSDIGMQQVMIQNTGGLKLRLDNYDFLQGRSNNWVAAVNINSSLPNGLFPFKVPIKLFFDAGTHAEVWKKNYNASKFLYIGGLQVILLKDVLNIYLPLFYSKVFKEALLTDIEANKFFRKITFSIDIQNISIKKLLPQLAY